MTNFAQAIVYFFNEENRFFSNKVFYRTIYINYLRGSFYFFNAFPDALLQRFCW